MNLAACFTRLEPWLTILKPPGEGPFPVSVQLHGCGGIQPMQFAYAEAARDAGVAVVVVDSLGPRGIGRIEAQLTVCSGLRLRGAERAADFVAVLEWLATQPWADPDRVAGAGWSHGGWSIMEALVEPPAGSETPVSRLKGVILFYPYAGPPARTHRLGWGAHRPKVYACLAGRDAVVGVRAPDRALRRLAADGLEVRRLTLPDATHCFDDENASDPRTRYRPDLTARARTFYVGALKACLSTRAL
jgi:dienelactone hydrolase